MIASIFMFARHDIASLIAASHPTMTSSTMFFVFLFVCLFLHGFRSWSRDQEQPNVLKFHVFSVFLRSSSVFHDILWHLQPGHIIPPKNLSWRRRTCVQQLFLLAYLKWHQVLFIRRWSMCDDRPPFAHFYFMSSQDLIKRRHVERYGGCFSCASDPFHVELPCFRHLLMDLTNPIRFQMNSPDFFVK